MSVLMLNRWTRVHALDLSHVTEASRYDRLVTVTVLEGIGIVCMPARYAWYDIPRHEDVIPYVLDWSSMLSVPSMPVCRSEGSTTRHGSARIACRAPS